MKIYEVQYRNEKFSGETDEIITVNAQSIRQALLRADKIMKNRIKTDLSRIWLTIRVQLVQETDN